MVGSCETTTSFTISCGYRSAVVVNGYIMSVIIDDTEPFWLLLVRERSALADPYCQSAWISICMYVCPQL